MRTREPEKYYARSRRSAHVPARLGTSVGGRWGGTTRKGERREGRDRRDDLGYLDRLPATLASRFSLLLILPRGIALPFFLPPRKVSAKNPRKRPRRRRGSADPSRIRWWTPGNPRPQPLRRPFFRVFVFFFLFYSATRLAVPTNRRARGRSIAHTV